MTGKESEITTIVQSQGRLVEKIDLTNQQITASNQQERYFPAAPFYRSAFGIEGYLFVDHHPEARWHSYTRGDCVHVPYHRGKPSYCGHDVPPTDDPIRLAHFFNTDQGFKLVRFFHLPEGVAQAFEEDAFSGDHLIEKCTRDRTLPQNFDEEPVSLTFLDNDDTNLKSLVKALTPINPAYSELASGSVLTAPNHRVYFSFHPWPWYNLVVRIGEESLIKALVNFDTVLERMSPQVPLEKQKLVLQEGQPNRISLPPAYS
jgi:hypothetical protein